jgi:hypothetical protein
MVAPIRIDDPAIAKAYRELLSKTHLGDKEVNGLIAAAKKDDGKIDRTEAADLQRIASANAQLFDPASRQRLAKITPDVDRKVTIPQPARLLPVPQQPTRQVANQAVSDKTRVARTLPSVHDQNGRPTGLPTPRQETISAAPPMTPERRRALEADARRRQAQENLNRMANLDPVASQINGMHQTVNGDWIQVSPSPLHIASDIAFGYSIPGRIVNGVIAGKAVVNAVQDPTPTNIGSAVVKVGLTGGGEWARAVHSPIKTPIAITKGSMNAWSEAQVGKKR